MEHRDCTMINQFGATGPTGDFPYGKVNQDDEGETRVAVAGDRETETVFIDFGKPTAWIGMRPEQAEQLAQSIRAAARRARRGGPDVDQVALETAMKIVKQDDTGPPPRRLAVIQVMVRKAMEAWGGRE
jgi:hypothetical protein